MVMVLVSTLVLLKCMATVLKCRRSRQHRQRMVVLQRRASPRMLRRGTAVLDRVHAIQIALVDQARMPRP